MKVECIAEAIIGLETQFSVFFLSGRLRHVLLYSMASGFLYLMASGFPLNAIMYKL